MFTYTKITLLLFLSTTFITIRTCVKEDTPFYEVNEDIEIPKKQAKSVEISAADSLFNQNAAITRAVLITHCGSCHQSTLDSHKPAAIRIFDLDQGMDWHKSLQKEHLEGIAVRTNNKEAITKQQKDALAAFLELKNVQLKKSIHETH